MRTWLLRWIVKPSDWIREATRPMTIPRIMVPLAVTIVERVESE